MSKMSIAILLCLAVSVVGAGPAASAGTSGAQFLGIGLGARPAAMGGACAAVVDGRAALIWNPAGLSRVGGHFVSVSHASWLDDASYQFATYATPLGSRGVVGLSLQQGSLSWDNTGDGSFEAGDFAGAVGYSYLLKSNLGIGADVRYISSTLGDDSAASYALDAGVVYVATDRLSFGAAVRHLGPGVEFDNESDPLPVTLVGGAAYRWRDVLLALDVEQQNDSDAGVRFGIEYSPLPYLDLRAGLTGGSESALEPYSAGVGFKLEDRWMLDYAYRPSDLGATHQVALTAALGGPAAIGAVPSGGGIQEAPAPRTNLTVLAELSAEAIEEAVGRMAIPAGASVYIEQVESNDAGWLVQSLLMEELTGRGHEVRAGKMGAQGAEGTETDAQVYQVSYRIVACEMTYPRVWRDWLVGTRKVERRAAVDIHFQLSNTQRAVLWAGSAKRERRDIVRGSRIPELVTPGQSFTAPPLDAGGWDKVLEPVVVAGIVGGLIYLFYTSRSTD
jgi:hypothetical protein